MMNANGKDLLIAVALIYVLRGAALLARTALPKVARLLTGFRNDLAIA